MKPNRKLLSFVLFVFSATFVSATEPLAFDFSQQKDGAVTRLEVPGGTLHAEAGNAEITAPPNNRSTRMLRVAGGKDKSVRFEFDAIRSVGFVQLRLERWTGKEPFELKVELQTERDWVEILVLDDSFKTGGQPPQWIALEKEIKAKALRLTATSAEQGGVLVKDVYLGPFGEIQCIGLESDRLQNITTPILLDGKGTPVQKIEFQVFGSVDPLETTVKVRLRGTQHLVSAAIGLGEDRYPLEALKDGEMQIRFNKKLFSKQILTLRLEPKDGTRLDERVRGGITEIETAGRKVRFDRPSEWPVARLLVAPGQNGVHTYRIPGIITSKKGTLLAVYDIRYKHSGDLPADIDVGLSRSVDGGETWEDPRVIMNFGTGDPKEGVGDPAILVDDKTGRIWVAALWAHGGHSLRTSKSGLKLGESGQFVLSYSDDDGKTWSKPRNITSEIAPEKDWRIVFNGPGGGITTRSGVLVFAAQYWDAKNMPHATIVYSKDRGETWKIGNPACPNTTEAQVVELTDGSLMLNMRDNRGGSRAVSVTKDFGETWTEHPTNRKDLPEPVCQASLFRLDWTSGKEKKGLVAFLNPNVPQGRYNMALQISEDDGMSWPRKLRVYDPNCYGYSSLTLIDPDHIGALYETEGGLIFQKIRISEVQ